jgi:glycine/D-amino acid oxidase-like deaminating enzyme
MSAFQTPQKASYDVVIIGGAMMGSSTAWFLSTNPDFDGSCLVIEMDSSYINSSTAHTNSCMRQQFSNELNVRISQFAADFVKNIREYMGGDTRVPELDIQNYGYMYLADNDVFANVLRENQQVQLAAGAETQLLSAQEIKARYPFYSVDDVVLGSINLKDEGYWDGGTVFDWWRRSAKDNGVEYVTNRAVAMNVEGGKVRWIRIFRSRLTHQGCISAKMAQKHISRVARLSQRMTSLLIQTISRWIMVVGKTTFGQLLRRAFHSLRRSRSSRNGQGIMPTTRLIRMRSLARILRSRTSFS